MQFSPSPRGHHVLAYNSSRIYVIDLRERNIEVKRELGILRRPVSTCIKDDGSVLAVLSTEMQVDIYDLQQSPPKRTRSIILDHSPRTIAMSPCGTVLAAAYEGGIEVSSLNPGALATDRRAVKCDGVDSLAFSFDSTQLLGTTVHSSPPNTVILTAPYFDPGGQMGEDDNISALWTTSILFPNTSRDCSHAVLLQNTSQEEACWTFTYDRSFETFRAVRIDDLRNGTTYFTGPIPSRSSQAKLIPCTLPTATYHGELVSAGFQGKDIWLYGVPEDLDAVADCASSSTESGSSASGLGRRNSGLSSRASSSRLQEPSGGRVPQWQVLCDKLRNTFVGGCKVAELDGVSNVKWVAGFGDSSTKERLVIAARGVLPPKPITEEDDIDFIDGGRMTLLDFDYSVANGERTEITIEVGTKEAEVLEEEQRDMETEVAIVRRRTVAQRGGNRNALLRAATTANRNNALPPLPSQPGSEAADDDPLVPRRVGARPSAGQPATTTVEEADSESIIEEQEALDAPYSHASPRSGTTLRRAATAAAVNRRLHPVTAGGQPVQYRRADGRAEHPHESDADNWVPPPPPYQKDDPGDLPAFLRHPAVVPGTSPASAASQPDPPSQPTARQTNPSRPAPGPPGPTWPRAQQPTQVTQTTQPVRDAQQPMTTSSHYLPHHQRVASDSTIVSRPHIEDSSRPMSSPSQHVDIDDIYDVSPPDSPRLAATSGNTSRRTSNAEPTVPQQGPTAHATYAGFNTQPPNRPWLATSSPTSSSSGLPSPPTLTPLQTAPRGVQLVDRPPALDLHIPSPTLSSSLSSYGWQSTQSPGGTNHASGRRLSNAQTWPTAPRPPATGPQTGFSTGYPHSAPPTGANANDMLAAALPPPPRPDQLASLSSRGEQSSPRRLSGGFHVPRVPVGSRSGTMESPRRAYQQPYQPQPQPQQPGMSAPRLNLPGPSRAATHPPAEDQPLIISTPKGVSGAFDPPDRRISGRRSETPLLAPIPRHPRSTPGSGPLRPTVERLETIYSVASHGAAADTGNYNGNAGGSSTSHSILPSWLTAPSSSSGGRHSSSLNRKQSRAERSAAKNIADAKRRGWSGGNGSASGSGSGTGLVRKKTKKRSAKKKARDYEVASSAAWTDVSGASGAEGQGHGGQKDKKCVIM
jgi:hypothetical protein